MPLRRRLLPPCEPLLGAALLALAALLTLALGTLFSGAPSAIDRQIVDAVRGAGPEWARRASIGVTTLGGGAALTIVTLGGAALLLARRRPLAALALVATAWTGGRAVALMKEATGRARPDLADRLVAVSSASFPSAHAANGAVVYLTLASLGAAAASDATTRRAIWAAALALVAAIGVSRVHLGAHWPSDVAAGWAFGALWAIGWRRLTAEG